MDFDLRDRELEIRQMLGWLNKAGLDDLVAERLARCAEARQKHDWATAIGLCWQVINQAKASDRISGNRDSIEGWGRMYLGAVYYCQADFSQAVDHFDRAHSMFSLDMANRCVAKFACGAAHARRGDRAGLDQSVTPQLVSTLRSMGIKGADTLWKTLESHCDTSKKATAASATNKTESAVGELKPLNRLVRRPILPFENEVGSRLLSEQVTMVVFIILLVAACAFVVVALTRTWFALIPYVSAWALASYLFVRKMKCVIPPGLALVVERSGVPSVIWGPETYYRWPILERAHALVPLSVMQYTSPKKSVSLSTDEVIEARILIYYAVDSADHNHKNVQRAVYNLQRDLKASRESQTPKRLKAELLTANQVKQQWESRLLSDVVLTLNEVLPGRSLQHLSGNEASIRAQLIDWLRDQLEQRAAEWGMAIGELSIVELSKAKA